MPRMAPCTSTADAGLSRLRMRVSLGSPALSATLDLSPPAAAAHPRLPRRAEDATALSTTPPRLFEAATASDTPCTSSSGQAGGPAVTLMSVNESLDYQQGGQRSRAMWLPQADGEPRFRMERSISLPYWRFDFTHAIRRDHAWPSTVCTGAAGCGTQSRCRCSPFAHRCHLYHAPVIIIELHRIGEGEEVGWLCVSRPAAAGFSHCSGLHKGCAPSRLPLSAPSAGGDCGHPAGDAHREALHPAGVPRCRRELRPGCLSCCAVPSTTCCCSQRPSWPSWPGSG